jgi:hypothetical protein
MDDNLVEEIAKRLAEQETLRDKRGVKMAANRTGVVTELHRKKARIAIAVIEHLRSRKTKDQDASD